MALSRLVTQCAIANKETIEKLWRLTGVRDGSKHFDISYEFQKCKIVIVVTTFNLYIQCSMFLILLLIIKNMSNEIHIKVWIFPITDAVFHFTTQKKSAELQTCLKICRYVWRSADMSEELQTCLKTCLQIIYGN